MSRARLFVAAVAVLLASFVAGFGASLLTTAPPADAAVHCYTEWNGISWERVCVIIPDWPDVMW